MGLGQYSNKMNVCYESTSGGDYMSISTDEISDTLFIAYIRQSVSCRDGSVVPLMEPFATSRVHFLASAPFAICY